METKLNNLKIPFYKLGIFGKSAFPMWVIEGVEIKNIHYVMV